MAMRTPLELEWKGEKFSAVVTMEVIDRLDSRVNLSMMVAQCAVGDHRMTQIAKLIALLLNEAGAEVTQEDVYTEIFAGGYEQAELLALLGVIFAAIFPEPKKSSGTSDAPKKKPTQRKKPATRGKRCTK